MKIRSVLTAVIEANYDWTLVRVITDEGVEGVGECFCAPGLTATIRDLSVLVEGEDARNVEAITRKLRLATAHAASGGGTVHHAISGIEAALWDLNARALGVPLWRLFGGKFRDRVRIYADCHAGEALESYSSVLVSRTPSWASLDPDEAQEVHWAPAEREGVYTPESYAQRAKQMVGRGFTALKFDLDLPLLPDEDLHARTISPRQLERQVSLADAACEAAGPDVEVAFDCHWRYAPSDALKLAQALEYLPVLWLEDPTPPEDVDALGWVTSGTSTRIATGENQYLLHGFTRMIESGAVNVVAPDVQKVGGLAETRRIAALADTRYLPMAPHNIAGPVGTMASVHVCASIPNFLALEWHAASVPFFDELVTGHARALIRDGWIEVPDAPGIGVELDLEACRRYARRGEPFFE
ncbi:MAG TPA: mandelate racemase/muconate lactonizing enzyme family protein [Actinomycetota bacterium]|nr:mandelate racemase/muconate lactonizing enzyme family protein [Actinomycetota bacterium]